MEIIYAFEEHWSTLGNVVEKCICIGLRSCSAGGYRDMVATPLSLSEEIYGGGMAAPEGAGDREKSSGSTTAKHQKFSH